MSFDLNDRFCDKRTKRELRDALKRIKLLETHNARLKLQLEQVRRAASRLKVDVVKFWTLHVGALSRIAEKK